MSNERDAKIIDILCKWNNRDVDPNRAMYEIWKLYGKEALDVWNKKYPFDEECVSEEKKEVD